MSSTPNNKIGNFISLRFPENLGTDEVPAYIRFTPQTVEYGGTKGLNAMNKPNLSYNTLKGGVPSALSKLGILGQIKQQAGGLVDSFASAASSAISSLGGMFSGSSFSSSLSSLGKMVSGQVRVGNFLVNLGQKTQPDFLRTEGSINMFLPNDLQAATSVQYDAVELGNRGAAGLDFAKEAVKGSSMDSVLEGAKKVGVGALADAMKNAGTVGSVVSMATGKVVNNFSFQLFNGVNHRKFDYVFKMVPKSAKETDDVKKICDTFLFLMLPSRVTGPAEVQFYEMPCQWKIEYQKQGKPLNYHMQPGPCFLESVNVTYGGESMNNLYENGAPMETTISLSFVEIEPLYRIGNLVSTQKETSTDKKDER